LTGKTYKLEMPATSNVLQYFSQDGSKVSIRPSGTEPKIKFYIEVRGEMTSRSDYEQAVAASDVKVKAVMASLGLS
jgi:phosphoglucomutase